MMPPRSPHRGMMPKTEFPDGADLGPSPSFPLDHTWFAWAVQDFQQQVELFKATWEMALSWGWFPRTGEDTEGEKPAVDVPR